MAQHETTRRALLGGAGLAVSAVAIGGAALAITPALTPFRLAEARYWAATKRFNSLPRGLEGDDPAAFAREEAAYLASVHEVDAAPVADWEEFAAQFDIAFDGGESLPNDALLEKLLADARRLAGRA